MTEAGLELRGLTKRYGRDGVPAVVSVDLSIPRRKILTVLGPSGSGKSTLLRLIAGLERPDQGTILIDGRPVDRVDPKDRDIAMVFQSYALYPHMRVRDNVAVPLRLRGWPRDRILDRVANIAERFGIGSLLARFPRELSGGERQRVALARALVREPKLFLLDEPLSNLDAQLRERARGELRRIFRELSATVVYVTHDQMEALTLSDLVAVMNAGRIEQVGAPEAIYERPETLFVAEFVGSPPINRMEGRLLCAEAAVVGCRPEDVKLGPGGDHPARIVLREPLGPQHLLTLQGEGWMARATVPAGFAGAEDEEVRVTFDPARLHRFDAAGRRIPPPDPADRADPAGGRPAGRSADQ